MINGRFSASFEKITLTDGEKRRLFERMISEAGRAEKPKRAPIYLLLAPVAAAAAAVTAAVIILPRVISGPKSVIPPAETSAPVEAAEPVGPIAEPIKEAEPAASPAAREIE